VLHAAAWVVGEYAKLLPAVAASAWKRAKEVKGAWGDCAWETSGWRLFSQSSPSFSSVFGVSLAHFLRRINLIVHCHAPTLARLRFFFSSTLLYPSSSAACSSSQAGVELDGDLLGHEGSEAAWAAGVENPEEANSSGAVEGAEGGADGSDGVGAVAAGVSPWQAKQNALK